MLQYNMRLISVIRFYFTAAMFPAILLLSLFSPEQACAYSKKAKPFAIDSVRFFDSLAALNRRLAMDSIKVPLRTIEAVQLDSVEALVLLADAHWSVHNYDKAGLFIRAAFAQYGTITPTGDDFPVGRYDSLYVKLVNKYKTFLAVSPILPPETPLEVLLQEDTEHLKVPNEVRARVDSLFRITPKEAKKFTSIFDEFGKKQKIPMRPVLPDNVPLPPVPVVTNKRVENALTFFLSRGSGVYQRWLDRAGRMLPVVLPILREEGIPEEIFCLAMIESGLNPNAYSRSQAAGIYQFISSTGEHYGLQTGWWYDERRNPEKAAHAACKYLRKLYNDFGDWYLAMAAYNSGEGRIARVTRRERTADFWRMKGLPRETRNYVPTYLASLLLFQEPERWGFKPPVLQKPWQSDTVKIEGVIDLNVAGKILGVSIDELKWRNPELVQFCTDPTVEQFLLKVPRGMGKLLSDSLGKMSTNQKIRWIEHTIRKGESLRSISRKYGIPEKAIAELPWNTVGIRSKNRVVVGSTIKIPLPVDVAADSTSS